MNSGHLNATLDRSGRLHIVGLWGLANADGGFYSLLQFVKEAVFNPGGGNFVINDIFPKKVPSISSMPVTHPGTGNILSARWMNSSTIR